MSHSPRRIVCLSAEAADWLWRIGAWNLVAGVTSFFKPPPGAPPKPRVAGFSTAQFDEISKLQPDLVITFSDVQAPLAAELLRRGLAVLGTNQRTLAETEATLGLLAQIVSREAEAEPHLREFRRRLEPVPDAGPRPLVYFEEWNDPLIGGIAWISELIERAGGSDLFAGLRARTAAADRVVSPDQVCRGNPQVIFASWCGKPVRITDITSRQGWQNLPAVRDGRVYEIPGADILQPGFRLVYGYEQIKQHLQPVAWSPAASRTASPC